MSKKTRTVSIAVIVGLLAVLLVGIILTNGGGGEEMTIKEVMKDAVLHDTEKISLFGITEVNPGFISAITVTAILLVLAALIRIFAVPKFTYVPGKFQLLIEEWVGFFDNLAKKNSPHHNGFLGAYVFAAGTYIFVSTMFELLGLQGVTTTGSSIALPAPLSDINGAIAMGVTSYLAILSGGIIFCGLRGVGRTLKEFSLPISMSFRLFGAMLSGLLVTELVYHYFVLSFVLPVIVGVLFTCLHALIQTYVLCMLTTVFYGEVTEPFVKKKKVKKSKNKNSKKEEAAGEPA